MNPYLEYKYQSYLGSRINLYLLRKILYDVVTQTEVKGVLWFSPSQCFELAATWLGKINRVAPQKSLLYVSFLFLFLIPLSVRFFSSVAFLIFLIFLRQYNFHSPNMQISILLAFFTFWTPHKRDYGALRKAASLPSTWGHVCICCYNML